MTRAHVLEVLNPLIAGPNSEWFPLPSVIVLFFATVREATGVKSMELDADNIRGVLETLKKRFGKPFLENVIDADTGELKKFFSFMVNGRRIELLEGYDTTLEDGDRVALFPPIGGG